MHYNISANMIVEGSYDVVRLDVKSGLPWGFSVYDKVIRFHVLPFMEKFITYAETPVLAGDQFGGWSRNPWSLKSSRRTSTRYSILLRE